MNKRAELEFSGGAFHLDRSTIQHLRFPFSFLLMPVFFLGLSDLLQHHPYPSLPWGTLVLAFLILHVLVYPSSNGYNSWCDQDEGPIGGILQPLPASRQLRAVSLLFDIAALLAGGLLISPTWALGLLAYIIASRAYSYPRIRLKSRPWLGWLTVVLFQGPWILGLVRLAAGQPPLPSLTLVLASALLFGGSYPITQIYQHEEDQRRGDLTLSRHLGVRGTLLFSVLTSGLGLILLLAPWVQSQLHAQLALFAAVFFLASIPLIQLVSKVLRDPHFIHSGPPAARAVYQASWALSAGLSAIFLGHSLMAALKSL
jgi:1,4-dihydroxy-2-naphthoate octaprenyltransferase